MYMYMYSNNRMEWNIPMLTNEDRPLQVILYGCISVCKLYVTGSAFMPSW